MWYKRKDRYFRGKRDKNKKQAKSVLTLIIL